MRRFILTLLTLLFIPHLFAADYRVPRAAYSVYGGDLDQDGDVDIVVGHNYCWETEWGGITILLNNGYGEFSIYDSLFIFSWQPDVFIDWLSGSENPDIVARLEKQDYPMPYFLLTVPNLNFADTTLISFNSSNGIRSVDAADIDGDLDNDIIEILDDFHLCS